MPELLKFSQTMALPARRNPLLIRMGRPFKQHLIISLAVLCLVTPVALIKTTSDAGLTLRFLLLAILLVLYTLSQLRLIRRFHSTCWLINPAVQWSLWGYLLLTISTLLLMLLPTDLQMKVGFDGNLNQWWVKYEWLNILGAVALWTGYWSGLASGLAKGIAGFRPIRRLLRPDMRLNSWVLWSFIIIAVGARLLAIHLGVYGYSASYDRLIEAAAYTQYLSMAADLGKVALIAVSLAFFSGGQRGKLLLVGLWLIETFFGILSGFKSAIVLPTIIIGICYYVQYGRLPRWLIPAVIIGIFIAYALIEPFRYARHHDISFDGTSVYSIVDTFLASQNNEMITPESDAVSIDAVARSLSRFSDVSIASCGIAYSDQVDILPLGSPDFLRDILLSPFYSFIPRVLWPSKPINDSGLWYTQIVMGKENIVSSTAMYPVTYLNFAGGAPAVFIGFFVVGVIQSVFFRGFMALGGSAAFLAVCTIGFLGRVDSIYYSFFISLLRYIPMLIIIQWLLFRPARRRKPVRWALKQDSRPRPSLPAT